MSSASCRCIRGTTCRRAAASSSGSRTRRNGRASNGRARHEVDRRGSYRDRAGREVSWRRSIDPAVHPNAGQRPYGRRLRRRSQGIERAEAGGDPDGMVRGVERRPLAETRLFVLTLIVGGLSGLAAVFFHRTIDLINNDLLTPALAHGLPARGIW